MDDVAALRERITQLERERDRAVSDAALARSANKDNPRDPTSNAPITTPAALDKRLVTAFFSIADSHSQKKKLTQIFGDITGADIDSLHASADGPDLKTLTQHGVTTDISPPLQYGDAPMDNEAIKWLREKLTLKKTTKKTLDIEDFLSIFRRLHLHYQGKFSPPALAETLMDALPDNMSKTFRDSFYGDGDSGDHQGAESLHNAWLATLLRHRNRPTPQEATATLTNLVNDFDDDVITQLENIREQAGFTSNSQSSNLDTALIYARMYLTNLGLDAFSLKTLTSPKASVDQYIDQFTSLYQSAKAARKELEELRQSLVKPKTQTVKEITTNTYTPDQSKEQSKLASQMGQLSKRMDQMSLVVANHGAHVSAMAAAPSPHLQQQSGYYRQPPPLPRPQNQPSGQHPVFHRRCLLCLGQDHVYRSCPYYPNQSPAPSMCWCRQGAHSYRACHSQSRWPPEHQRDNRNMERSGFGTHQQLGVPRPGQGQGRAAFPPQTRQNTITHAQVQALLPLLHNQNVSIPHTTSETGLPTVTYPDQHDSPPYTLPKQKSD